MSLDAALYYLSRGAVPIPLDWPAPDGTSGSGKAERPRDIGKRPLLGRDYNTVRPTEADVREWWRRWPLANIGLLLEPSGLVLVDADCPEAVAAVEAAGVAGAIKLETGKGAHYYWKRPDNLPPRRVIKARKAEGWLWHVSDDNPTGDGVDVLARGYAVVWPSVHQTGRRYGRLDLDQLVAPPRWVRELLDPPRTHPAPSPSTPTGDVDLDELQDALDAIDPDLEMGEWVKIGMAIHDATRGSQLGLDLWDRWSSRSETKYHPRECERRWRTFRDGAVNRAYLFRQALDAGWRPRREQPRGVERRRIEARGSEPYAPDLDLPERLLEMPSVPLEMAAPPQAPAEPPPPRRREDSREDDPLEHDSHTYLARYILPDLQGDSPLPVLADGAGLWRYAAPVWVEVEEAAQRQAVQRLDRRWVYKGDNSKGEPRYGIFKADKGTITGVLNELTFLEEVHQKDFFEEAPQGVQLSNGFLRLLGDGEVELCPPHPEHRQRAAFDFPWDPSAPASAWERAMGAWMRHPDAVWEDFARGGEAPFDPELDEIHKYQFLQEFAGACLFGLAPRRKKVALLLGTGDNGKSLFIETISSIFPPEAISSVPPQHFEDDYKAAMLRGKRLNVVPEIPGEQLAFSATFKAAVAGDPIIARNPYEKPINFRPEAGHIFGANALPPTRDQSHGFWSRFVVVGFDQKWTLDGKGGTHRADPALARTLAREAGGVLVWAVRGAQRLIQQGHYTIPESSRLALRGWQEDTDPVLAWLAECTRDAADKTQETESTKCWEDFDRWQKRNGYKPRGSRTFYNALVAHKGHPRKTRYGRFYPIELLDGRVV